MAKNDKALEAAMRSHRPRGEIAAEMATTVFGQMAQEAAGAQMLPVNRIVRSRFQSRTLDEEHVESLRLSIETSGLHTPLMVRPIPAPAECQSSDTSAGGGECQNSDTWYELIAGDHRLEAFRRLGRPSVPAVIRHFDDVQAARALTEENTQRKGLTDWELFKHIGMLRKVGAVKSVTDLASLLRVSRAQIYNLEAFQYMPAAACALLETRPDLVSGTVAYELKGFAESVPGLVEEAIQHVADGKIKQSGVVGWVQRKISRPVVPFRREVEIKDQERTIKLVTTVDEAKVTGDLDFEKLHALIVANLEQLRRS